MAMAGIAPEDDDGNAAAKAPPKQDRQQELKKPYSEAVQKATEYLAEADSLDDLKERWERLPKPVAANADVIAAKDAAKERMNATTGSPVDLDGDHIPY